VEITAAFGDPTVASDGATITVATPTLFMVIGTDNRVQKNDAEVTYDKVFSALITDSAGNPAPPETVFRLTLRSLEYQKGIMEQLPTNDDPYRPTYTVVGGPFFGTPGPYYGAGPFGCRTEDPTGAGIINL